MTTPTLSSLPIAIEEYAEALLQAMRLCRDSSGQLLKISFGSPVEDEFIAKQIATHMLGYIKADAAQECIQLLKKMSADNDRMKEMRK